MSTPQSVGATHRAAPTCQTPVPAKTFGPLFDRHQVERLRAESVPHVGDESNKAIEFARCIAIFSLAQGATLYPA
jgi:hypothetical protein